MVPLPGPLIAPADVMTLRTLLISAVLPLSVACHPNRPVVDTGPRPNVGGTISGTVTDGNTPLGGRKVTAVDVEKGERFDTSTTATGGYTVRVPSGRYRMELEVRAGEMLGTTPDPTDVDPGDLDAGRDFVVLAAAKP